ncbi:MAG: SRPBCC family protein [Methylophilaceae bacterium]
MLKMIFIVLIMLVVTALILAALKPDNFSISRTVSIKATPEKIAPLISDFHNMQTWSAWEKVDPAMQRNYSGADRGVGAHYAWQGNKDIGSGSMEITESSLTKIAMKLDFTAPFEAHNMVEFTLTPNGDSTTVTHVMSGPSPYISKVMSLVFSMDKMVGTKFEEGLANLKANAEK